jgi:serine/threonine protein kinase
VKLIERIDPPDLHRLHELRTNEIRDVTLVMSPPAVTIARDIITSWREQLAEDYQPWAFLRETFYQLASGLAYIHRMGIIHHDIKADNIGFVRVRAPVRVVLFDLGSAEKHSQTLDHGAGTTRYLAPEVMRVKVDQSTEPFSFPVDIWALGCTLLEFLRSENIARHIGEEGQRTWLMDALSPTTLGLTLEPAWHLAARIMAWEPESRPLAAQLEDELRPTTPELLLEPLPRPSKKQKKA